MHFERAGQEIALGIDQLGHADQLVVGRAEPEAHLVVAAGQLDGAGRETSDQIALRPEHAAHRDETPPQVQHLGQDVRPLAAQDEPLQRVDALVELLELRVEAVGQRVGDPLR